jgi:16S rRNA C967 or C1407 C5-methylase (RsmB/RsmF family)
MTFCPEHHKKALTSTLCHSNYYSLRLINQNDDDFIQESQEQLREFSAPTNPDKEYMSLLEFLNKTSEATPSSNCSGWLFLLDSGYGDRKKGTIRYAVIAIAFARWHASEVQFVEGAKTVQQESRQVSARILDPIVETRQREQQRKRLGTHLARGRKWLRLVEGLGTGILFKEAW